MGRRGDEDRTRQNRTRGYSSGGYERPGYGRGERPGERRGEYPDEGLYGPYFDRRGTRYFEDPQGRLYYDDNFSEPYYRDYERDRYESDRRQSTGRTAIKWAGIVAVALILVVGMVLATDDFTGNSSDSAPGAAQQPQAPSPQAPQEQPVAPQQPQAPSAPQQPDGASSEQVEGMRADIERQLVEIRQSINQLRLEIWSFFANDQQEQQSSP